MTTNDDCFEFAEVELISATDGPIMLDELKGHQPRGTFSSWEKQFTEQFGMTPDESLAYKVTWEEKKSGQYYSVVVVFTDELILFGQGTKNGIHVTHALGN